MMSPSKMIKIFPAYVRESLRNRGEIREMYDALDLDKVVLVNDFFSQAVDLQVAWLKNHAARAYEDVRGELEARFFLGEKRFLGKIPASAATERSVGLNNRFRDVERQALDRAYNHFAHSAKGQPDGSLHAKVRDEMTERMLNDQAKNYMACTLGILMEQASMDPKSLNGGITMSMLQGEAGRPYLRLLQAIEGLDDYREQLPDLYPYDEVRLKARTASEPYMGWVPGGNDLG